MAAERHQFKRTAVPCSALAVESKRHCTGYRCRQMTATTIIAIVTIVPQSVQAIPGKWIGCPTTQTRSQVNVDRLQRLLAVLVIPQKQKGICYILTAANTPAARLEASSARQWALWAAGSPTALTLIPALSCFRSPRCENQFGKVILRPKFHAYSSTKSPSDVESTNRKARLSKSRL
jgi:hypothetical protein